MHSSDHAQLLDQHVRRSVSEAFPEKQTARGTKPRQCWIQTATLQEIDRRTTALRQARHARLDVARASRAVLFFTWAHIAHYARACRTCDDPQYLRYATMPPMPDSAITAWECCVRSYNAVSSEFSHAMA
eukprot:6701150-Pyramimonas_sp.AAC.1